MQLAVSGYVRISKPNSYCGTVVVLVTALGQVTVDGGTLTFIEELGGLMKVRAP